MAKKPAPKPASRPASARARSATAVREFANPAPDRPPTHPPPLPLDQILGQDRARAILDASIRSGRLHHAWIFHGPRGVGKFTVALSFAALLLDPTTKAVAKGPPRADTHSPVAGLLATGSHPDLHVVRKELARYHDDPRIRDRKLSNIPVDVVRSFLLDPGNLAAAVSNPSLASKVFIVDEAELLAGPAQNAVLKFLEEPPDRTVVILVTSSEEALLPTIRSRCQRVPFLPLSPKDLSAWLKHAGVSLPPPERDWLIAFAQGAPGVIDTATRLGLASWWQRLAPMLDECAQGRYCPDLGPTCHQLVDEFALAQEKSGPNISKDASNKEGAAWMLRLLAHRWSASLADSPDNSLACLDAISAAEHEIDANVNLLFIFEKLSAEFADAATPHARA
jgi:DNA polymerase-3 subunit delta'